MFHRVLQKKSPILENEMMKTKDKEYQGYRSTIIMFDDHTRQLGLTTYTRKFYLQFLKVYITEREKTCKLTKGTEKKFTEAVDYKYKRYFITQKNFSTRKRQQRFILEISKQKSFSCTKMRFSIIDFSNKCDQTCSFL